MEGGGRAPYPERKPEARSFYMGEHGRFTGEVPRRPDQDIKHDVESALFYDTVVSSLGINVEVQNGEVTLTGKTLSDEAKRAASDNAWKVAGVRNVKNDIQSQQAPTPSRAAGEDLTEAKPPEAIYGEPPDRMQTGQSMARGASPSEGEAGASSESAGSK